MTTRLARALCIATVALAGCGLVGDEPFPETRFTDVTPWKDSGPVRFCFGGERAGLPGSPKAGFCGASVDSRRACTEDSACGSRETCQCGACQVTLCDSDDECGPDGQCNVIEHRCDRACKKDADCTAGEVCPGAVGFCRGTCTSDGECQGGEACQDGLCVVEVGLSGALCAADSECPGHPTCHVQRTPLDVREVTPFVGGDPLDAPPFAVELRDMGRSSIWQAACDFGSGWARLDRIECRIEKNMLLFTAPGDAHAPSVLDENPVGVHVLYVDEEGVVRHVWVPSSTGVPVGDPNPLFMPSAPWQQRVDSVAIDRGSDLRYVAYFSAADGSAIGVARGGYTFDDPFVADPTPIVTAGDLVRPGLFEGVDRIGAPFLDRPLGGSSPTRLWFHARGRESGDATKFGVAVPEAPNFSICEAQSGDGKTFVPYPWNPVFDRAVQFVDHRSEMEPSILRDPYHPGRRALLYRATSADGSKPEGIRAAVIDE